MAKLDQDNKLLAELDEKVLLNQKIRTANASFKSSSLQQANSLLANAAAATAAAQLHSSLPSLTNQSSNLLNLSSLASKNLLSQLEATDLAANSYSGLAGLNSSNLASNLGTANLLDQTSLGNRQALSQPTLNATSALTSALNNVANQQKQLQNQIQHQIQQQQQLLNNTLSSNLANATTNFQASSIGNPAAPQPPAAQPMPPSAQSHRANEIRIAEDIVDSIEIANRGRFRVFIARYSYDPFKQSPNEHPEAELHLNAGDFLLVQVLFQGFKNIWNSWNSRSNSKMFRSSLRNIYF